MAIVLDTNAGKKFNPVSSSDSLGSSEKSIPEKDCPSPPMSGRFFLTLSCNWEWPVRMIAWQNVVRGQKYFPLTVRILHSRSGYFTHATRDIDCSDNFVSYSDAWWSMIWRLWLCTTVSRTFQSLLPIPDNVVSSQKASIIALWLVRWSFEKSFRLDGWSKQKKRLSPLGKGRRRYTAKAIS